MCSEWTRDVSELASQLGDLIAGALTPGAAARAVLPFEGPSELRDEGGQSWLEAALAEARTASFAVRQVAVTAQRTGQLTGVLVGEHRPQTGAQAGRLAPAELAVDARASGERRARIHRNALDSGFEFAE